MVPRLVSSLKLDKKLVTLWILFGSVVLPRIEGKADASKAFVVKTIYGEDSRQEVSQLPKPFFEEWIRRTVALVEPQHLVRSGQQFFGVAPGVGQEYELCADERFYHQPTLGFCTAFFIHKNWLVTAKHCIEDMRCSDFRLVSSYQVERLPRLWFDSHEIFGCRDIVVSETEDLAFLKVDGDSKKAVNGIESEGKKAILDMTRDSFFLSSNPSQGEALSAGTAIEIIGFPLGLPMKWASGEVLKKKHGRLFAAIDAFEGNSGSPILKRNQGLLGILLGGDEDFVPSKGRGCQRAFRCEDEEQCEGEEILGVETIKREFHRLTDALNG